MQASSNREENRTVLSFMAHLSLTFLVFSFLSSIFSFSFSFESIEHVGVYTIEIPKSREQWNVSSRWDHSNDLELRAKSPEITRRGLCKSREFQRARRRPFVLRYSWMKIATVLSLVYIVRSMNKRKINVIVNGQHDNTTRTTIMWHDDHRSVQAHRNRSCRYKVNCYISQRRDRVYIIS